jgi:hypothetical protein
MKTAGNTVAAQTLRMSHCRTACTHRAKCEAMSRGRSSGSAGNLDALHEQCPNTEDGWPMMSALAGDGLAAGYMWEHHSG